MRFVVVTLFPELLGPFAGHGVSGRAVESGLIRLDCVDPRTFTHDRHRNVDDRPFGGGPGMLMQTQPMFDAIGAARTLAPNAQVVLFSPQGERFQQSDARAFAAAEALILVCGRYEGVDERVVESVDRELSIGDYVLSGGEFAAMVVMDAVARLVPGVLGDEGSAVSDTFADSLLEGPQYTRPRRARLPDGSEADVPEVLLSGDHALIARWRLQQALLRTWRRRPDLLARRGLSPEEADLLRQGADPELDRDRALPGTIDADERSD